MARSKRFDRARKMRRDGSAEAAVVVGDGLGPLKSRMYNPDDEIAIGDRQLAAIFRICAVILL